MLQTQLDAFCTGGSSSPSSACDTVSTAAPSILGTKRGPVPKRRSQKGTFVKRGDYWVGTWRVDTLQPDGTKVSASYLQIDGDAHCRRINFGKRNFARC